MALPENTSRSPLEALSIGRFGGKSYPQEAVTNVPITRINLLPNNPNRFYWRLINEGAFDVRISTSPNITALSGWLLQANGGMISMDWENDGETVGYQVYAIANGNPSNVRSMEVIRE